MKQMSFTGFKKACARRGLNPVIATKLHQLGCKASSGVLSPEKHTELYKQLRATHPVQVWEIERLGGRFGTTI